MSIKPQYLIYIICAVVLALLIYVSSGAYNPTSSILAQVEPQKHAISFHKAVRVKEIFVIPGQMVKKGDPLLKVERQDMLLEVESKSNSLENLLAEKEVLQIENRYQQDVSKMNLELKINTITADLKRLELLKNDQSKLSRSMSNLHIWGDSVTTMDQSYIDMRIQVLLAEKSNYATQIELLTTKLNQLYILKCNELDNKIQQVKSELALLKQEENELLQVAKQDGIVGNLYAEEDELLSPFSTLISIYDHNPSVIRALINEHHRFDLEIGQSVMVESTNRKYEVKGTIMEIGTRIVEYPNRLKTNQEIMMYGREIFISIPIESDFLHGEKVFVKLK